MSNQMVRMLHFLEGMVLTIFYETRTDALSKTVKNEGQKPRWSQQDAYILVHK